MENKTPFIIIGDGAEARDALDITLALDVLVYGFFSMEETEGIKEINDVSVITQLGSDDANALLAEEEIQLTVAVPDMSDRKTVADLLEQYNRKPANLIHPQTIISNHAKMGYGNIIAPGVIMGANAEIGNYCHINSRATIEADALIGEFVNIRAGAVIGKNVQIGHATHIGMGAVIFPGVKIGVGAKIAPGAVVIQDVDAGKSVAGNPAVVTN
jgi:sugar O-acyltransferase (sialic acid O-acetyltransferase NeuD family)